MWDQIRELHACHADVPDEIRLLKLTEETGEVAEAFVGMHGMNSRKGVCRSRDNLLAELGDVIITAAVAMTGVTGGDIGEARSQLEQRSAGCHQWLAMGHQQPRRRSHPPRPQDTRPAPRDNLTRRRPERLSGQQRTGPCGRRRHSGSPA